MQPTPESYDAVVDWYTRYSPTQADKDLISEVLRCLELDTLTRRFYVHRDLTAPYRDVVLPRPGLVVLVDYFPEAPPERFHIVSIYEDPDADHDPSALP